MIPFWNARYLLETLGDQLIGRKVITEPMGEWKGGECEVIALNPAPEQPENVFLVRRLDDGEEIGVFSYERVELKN